VDVVTGYHGLRNRKALWGIAGPLVPAESVHTPSAQQVRQPINRRGIDAWLPYSLWLGPLEVALGAVLDLYPACPPTDRPRGGSRPFVHPSRHCDRSRSRGGDLRRADERWAASFTAH
jgi:hypothetical protein